MGTYDCYCNACEKTTQHKLNGDCLECILKYVPPIATGNTYTQPPKENSAHSFTEGADVPESVPSCGDGWISVKDRLPDEEHDYIVFVDGEQPFVAHFFLYPADGSNWICYGHAVFPTHWQPLPKAPTKH